MSRHERIPLELLKFGHESHPPLNARKSERETDVDSLACSIAAHGLIQPLSVRLVGDVPFVTDGNRRLAALRALQADGQLPAGASIDCMVADGAGSAFEESLAANIQRVAMHGADEYEAFHQLVGEGLSEGQIAERFGIDPARVKRILAVGRVSPLILDAWRAGEFERDAISIIRAFTLAPDIASQEKAYQDLKKKGQLHAFNIRREFGGDDGMTDRLIRLVGVDAYIEAGGKMTEDLFDGQHIVHNPELLPALAEKALADKVAGLKADGWAWVSMADDLPYSWSWSWDKIEIGIKGLTAKQKAESGAVIAVNHRGEVIVTVGVQKPVAKKPEKSADAAPGEKPAPSISSALIDRLSVQNTTALSRSLSEMPHLGFAVLLAGFLASPFNNPVKVSTQGSGHIPRGEDDFAATLAVLAGKTDDELKAIATDIAAKALSVQTVNGRSPSPYKPAADAIRAMIPDSICFADATDLFDAADYFKTAPKAVIIDILRSALGQHQGASAEKMKKAELAAFAKDALLNSGWLPPELRGPGYSGPGSAAPQSMSEAA